MVNPRPIFLWLIFTAAALNAAARAPLAFDVTSTSTRNTTSSSSSLSSTYPTAPSSHSTNTSTPSSRSSSSQSNFTNTKSSGTNRISTSFALTADRPLLTSSRASPPISPQYPPASRVVSTASFQKSGSSSPATTAGISAASTSSSYSASSISPTTSASSTTVFPASPQSLSGTTTISSPMSAVSFTSVTPVAPTSSSTPAHEPSPTKLSTGGIIGTIVAVFGFFWLAALALWWLLRKWRASKAQGTRTGRPAWQLGMHRYEQADANEAPLYDTTAPDALQPASHHGFGDKEAMLLNSSPTPSSRPPTPLHDPSPLAEEGARCRSGSPATLVDRPPSLATSRPPSLKNTELLALAGTDYSVAVARARSRSSSAPQPCPNPNTSMAELHTAFGAELARTSTNPFRERMRAAEAARQNARLGADEDRDWWAGQQA